jgi:hypothetical protein
MSSTIFSVGRRARCRLGGATARFAAAFFTARTAAWPGFPDAIDASIQRKRVARLTPCPRNRSTSAPLENFCPPDAAISRVTAASRFAFKVLICLGFHTRYLTSRRALPSHEMAFISPVSSHAPGRWAGDGGLRSAGRASARSTARVTSASPAPTRAPALSSGGTRNIPPSLERRSGCRCPEGPDWRAAGARWGFRNPCARGLAERR